MDLPTTSRGRFLHRRQAEYLKLSPSDAVPTPEEATEETGEASERHREALKAPAAAARRLTKLNVIGFRRPHVVDREALRRSRRPAWRARRGQRRTEMTRDDIPF
jgi:hypothetical protein